MFASAVKKGDSVLVYDNLKGLKFGVVVGIEEMISEGVYSPVTYQGNIFVDDVLASCYSDFDSHELQHLALTPFRWMYRLFEFISHPKLENMEGENADNQNDDGVHWFGQGLHVFSRLVFSWKLH